MDPASIEGTLPHLTQLLQAQGRMLGEHARLLTEAAEVVTAIRQEIRVLSAIQQAQAEQLAALTTQVHALTNPGPVPPQALSRWILFPRRERYLTGNPTSPPRLPTMGHSPSAGSSLCSVSTCLNYSPACTPLQPPASPTWST